MYLQNSSIVCILAAVMATASAKTDEANKQDFVNPMNPFGGPIRNSWDGVSPFSEGRPGVGTLDSPLRPCRDRPIVGPIEERRWPRPDGCPGRLRPERLLYDVPATKRPHWSWDCSTSTTTTDTVDPTTETTTMTTTKTKTKTTTITPTCSCPTITTTVIPTTTTTSSGTIAPTSTSTTTTPCVPCTVTNTVTKLPEYVATTIILCDIEGQSRECLREDERALDNLVQLALQPGAKVFVDGVEVQAKSGSVSGASASSGNNQMRGGMSAASMNAKSSSASALNVSKVFATFFSGAMALGLAVILI